MKPCCLTTTEVEDFEEKRCFWYTETRKTWLLRCFANSALSFALKSCLLNYLSGKSGLILQFCCRCSFRCMGPRDVGVLQIYLS